MLSGKRKILLAFLQIGLWVVFISLPYFMVPHQMDEGNIDSFMRHAMPHADMAENMFISSLAFNLLLIIFFYIHHYFIFDRFVSTKRYVSYVLVLVLCFVVIFYGSHIFKRFVFESVSFMMRPISFREFIRAFNWYLLILSVGLGVKLLMQLKQTEQRAREIENAQLRTELSFLHAQINPHFLFNSLNTIYSLALKKSDSAPAAVLKLSHLLRYVIDDANRESVALEQEINYLNNYIDLQKLRSTASLVVNFNVTGNISSTQIAPLLLLPFVENAFKYGISNQEPSPIDITLERTASSLTFSVQNKKFEQGEKDSTGIGINNVKRRLELLYHDKHVLEIEDKTDSYFIKLTIQFT